MKIRSPDLALLPLSRSTKLGPLSFIMPIESLLDLAHLSLSRPTRLESAGLCAPTLCFLLTFRIEFDPIIYLNHFSNSMPPFLHIAAIQGIWPREWGWIWRNRDTTTLMSWIYTVTILVSIPVLGIAPEYYRVCRRRASADRFKSHHHMRCLCLITNNNALMIVL